jgi:branched-chain amino acid transport system substrate-binding protein
MLLRRLGAIALMALFVVAACQPGATPAPGTPGQPGESPMGTPGESPMGTPGESPMGTPGESPMGTPGESPTGEVPQDPMGVVQIPAGEPIHIAFWGVVSGPDAALGEDSRRGLEIAISDREELMGRQLRLSSQDALCTPEGGATAATALVADQTIVGLIGSTCSAETAGGIQTITDQGFTTISPSNTRPAFTDPELRGAELDGYLRTAHSDAIQGVVAADFVYNELGITEAATIHMSEAYSEALVGVFQARFEELGGTITGTGATQRGETDMRPLLTDMAAGNPGAIYYPLFTAEFGFVTAQVRDIQGLEETVLMGADAGFSAEAISASGPNAEGAYLSSPDFTAFGSGYQDFLGKYQDAFGQAPIQIFHAHAYDAANILMDAIEEVAVEVDGTLYVGRQALREAIFATSNFEGITGTLNCDEFGDCSAPVIAVYQITPEIAQDPQGNWPPEPFWRPEN